MIERLSTATIPCFELGGCRKIDTRLLAICEMKLNGRYSNKKIVKVEVRLLWSLIHDS